MPACDERTTVAVIGAGAWGTALAWLAAGIGHGVRLWVRRAERADAIRAQRENAPRLPGVRLPDNVRVSADLAQTLAGARHVITAVPSAYLRETARSLAPHLSHEAALISATKGLELGTGKRMSSVLIEETGLDPCRILALSGPNLSAEVAAGMPAVSVLAGADATAVAICQRFFSTPLFRIYTTCDILGVEVCGALKNVIAIGAGVSDGLGYGANAKAAIVTRGMAEIGRLGTKLGAGRATFWGAAGVGDVLATCNSQLSRNWQVGYRLGQGETAEAIGATQTSVAEGIPTTAAARGLAAELGVDAPITNALHQVIFNSRAPVEAVQELMTRRWRVEPEDWQ